MNGLMNDDAVTSSWKLRESTAQPAFRCLRAS